MTLDYMHARYYTFKLGRFTSVDPVGGKVGLSQSWNRYAYVRGNPVNAVDPDGRLDNGLLAEVEADRLLVKELGAQRAQKVFAARQEAKARIGGVFMSTALAAATGGESPVWNLLVGAFSNTVGGMFTRAADGKESTRALDVKNVTVDAAVGVLSTKGANKVLAGVRPKLAAGLGAGGANATEQATSATLSVGGGAAEEWAEGQLSTTPNPKASDPSVNCHRPPCAGRPPRAFQTEDDSTVASHDRAR